SGNTPRYHARQVAMYRASTLNIPLVMGSATPSVEAWHLMKEKKFVPHSLTKRLAGGCTPSIMCIDLKSEKDSSCISKKLQEEIQNTLNQKKQTILFLNRRGFTHFFKCSNCSYEMICKNCSVPMTYHKKDHLLKCHYCGWAQSPVSSCPECGSLDIGYHGFGTEYIEAETKAKFPNARVLRIDTDSISQKGELEEKINSFREGKYDILLGTQMVAKGLNFPNLLLVGIILADTGLHMPDFRSYERTFALITQVAGRAGRFFPNGKVIVQTYSPKVEPIAFACNGNTPGFYKQELDKRCMLEFPPFSRIARLVFRSANSKSANLASNDAHKILSEIARKEKLNVEILGPGECPIFKISKNYRYQILLRSKNVKALQHLSKTLLFGYTKAQDVYIECDIDPVHLL
ncbi:MAG: primosomal protein N', partial [Treponema sp.]|nr:primosomal protein N' [Treponema sp.]